MEKGRLIFVVSLACLIFGGLSFVSALEDGSQFVSDLSSGVTRTFYAGNVLGFNVLGGRHTFLLVGIKDDVANVRLSEPSQTAAMAIGEEKRFDFNGDGIMDVYVMINDIIPSGVTSAANVTVRTIAESAVSEASEPVESAPADNETAAPAASIEEQNENDTGSLVEMETAGESSGIWIWIVAGVVVVAAVFGFMRFKKRR